VLRTRVFTALVLLPAVLGLIVWAPDQLFTGFIALVTAWGLYEVAFMTRARGTWRLIALIVAGSVPAILMLYGERASWIAALSLIVAMVALIVEVAISGAQGPREGAPLVILGALYVGVLFPYFALLRNGAAGVRLLVLILLLTVASDTGAYFVGKFIGRLKLAPAVSPHKTVEGAVGGLGLCIAAGLVLRGFIVPDWPIRRIIVGAAAIGVSAQVGDLACSAYKRVAGVKDSGWIFPGHGGLLDRASSLVLAVAFTYYYSQ
jgi:phosphatidate cytidylyltransferase